MKEVMSLFEDGKAGQILIDNRPFTVYPLKEDLYLSFFYTVVYSLPGAQKILNKYHKSVL